jgi:hypothetical protein
VIRESENSWTLLESGRSARLRADLRGPQPVCAPIQSPGSEPEGLGRHLATASICSWYEYRSRHHHDPGQAIRRDPRMGAHPEKRTTQGTSRVTALLSEAAPKTTDSHSTNITAVNTPATIASRKCRFRADTAVPSAGPPTRRRSHPVSMASSTSVFLRSGRLATGPRNLLGTRLESWACLLVPTRIKREGRLPPLRHRRANRSRQRRGRCPPTCALRQCFRSDTCRWRQLTQVCRWGYRGVPA